MNETNYPQIQDGFCYSGLFGTRPLNHSSWYWSCLANMDDLRLAADSYTPRWWIVPKNFLDPTNPGSVNILNGKTVFYEFQVKPGSFLWGLQFGVSDNGFLAAQASLSVIIRQGSDLPLFDRVMTCSGIASGNPADPLNTLFPAVDLLWKPRLILEPAQIHVEISNNLEPTDPSLINAQLLMLFAEPKV